MRQSTERFCAGSNAAKSPTAGPPGPVHSRGRRLQSSGRRGKDCLARRRAPAGWPAFADHDKGGLRRHRRISCTRNGHAVGRQFSAGCRFIHRAASAAPHDASGVKNSRRGAGINRGHANDIAPAKFGRLPEHGAPPAKRIPMDCSTGPRMAPKRWLRNAKLVSLTS